MNEMPEQLKFDYQKATQALNYFIRKDPSLKMNKMKLIKLIWLADRYHLRTYGRPVLGDEYIAMKLGPVGSYTKDIAENSSFLSKDEKEYVEHFIRPLNQYTVTSLSITDKEVFSESDIEALEFSYKHYGKFGQFDLSNMSHEFPEWKKFESLLSSRQSTHESMDYLDFFKDTESAVDDPFQDSQANLEATKEIFIENFRNQNGI